MLSAERCSGEHDGYSASVIFVGGTPTVTGLLIDQLFVVT